MLQLTVDNTAVLDYMQAVQMRIFAGIREGMAQVVEGLGNTVAGFADGEVIVSRSGAFIGAVLGSERVTENDTYIRGTVSGMVGKKPMGLWFDEGTSVPEVRVRMYQFFPPDGESVWTHGHAAFQVAPHPIMNRSLETYAPTILEIISAKCAEATSGTV